MSEKRIPLSPQLAVDVFIKTWGADSWLAGDIATSLTCREAEALADLLTAFGAGDAAEMWISAHAEGDDEGDMHWSEDSDE